MPTHATWCRLSECMTSLLVETDGTRITRITQDKEGPMGRSAPCGLCTSATDIRTGRLARPRKRTGDRWEEVEWDTALNEIGARLKAIRKAHGPNAIATLAGAPVGFNTRGAVRTGAWALALGSTNLYTPLAEWGGPWLRACELVLGRAVPLQGDVARAHYVLLLGANQEAQGWGPLQAGRDYSGDLAHSRKTKGTKLVTADPRKTPLSASADIHLPIRPGTEVFLLLGMVGAILKNDWWDRQYVDDYCAGREQLTAALAAWPLERCAEACGIPAADLGGVALKFSRSAMAVAHRSPQALASEHGTLTAWACLVLHALTANLLRPGGLFENRALAPVRALAGELGTENAPRTRVGNHALVLLQAPSAALVDEIVTPGEGQVHALLALHADPARELPGGPRVLEALASLDLLVALDVTDTATTRLAHFVLPGTHAWERADSHVHDTAMLPYRCTQRTPALVAPFGEAREEADVLAELFSRVGPALRSGFGPVARVRGGRLVTSDVDGWLADQLTRGPPAWDALGAAPHGWFGGEVDRATWAIDTASGRIELLPDAIARALAVLTPPAAPPGFTHWLLTSAARDGATRPYDRPAHPDPGVTLHPSAGFAEGSRVRIRTAHGSVEALVHLDEGLRPDVVDLPAGYSTPVGNLIPADRLDPIVGTAPWNGLACAVEAV